MFGGLWAGNVEVAYRSRLLRWSHIGFVFVEVKRHHYVTHPDIRHSSRDKMEPKTWISRKARGSKGGKGAGRGRGEEV